MCSKPESQQVYYSQCSIYHIVPEDWQIPDTSLVEPRGSEASNSNFVIVEEVEYSDEDLMDDTRPGRRKGQVDEQLEAQCIVMVARKVGSRKGGKKGECEGSIEGGEGKKQNSPPMSKDEDDDKDWEIIL
jgi:hypothetical protein